MGMYGERAERLLTNRRLVALVALAVTLGLLALFVADNFVLVDVRVFWFDLQVRLAWAMLIPAAGGVVLGYVLGRLRR